MFSKDCVLQLRQSDLNKVLKDKIDQGKTEEGFLEPIYPLNGHQEFIQIFVNLIHGCNSNNQLTTYQPTIILQLQVLDK